MPLTGMTGGGPFKLRPGEWTDDTSMALCMAESLVECRGFNAIDQLTRYLAWYETGKFSSTGKCFDIGAGTLAALKRFKRTGEPFPGSAFPESAGNGALMRLTPIPLFFAEHPSVALEMAARSALVTHGAPEAQDACRFFAGLILGALRGETRELLLSSRFSPLGENLGPAVLHPKVLEVANGSYKQKEPPFIHAGGYVVTSLEAALWAFHHATDFADGCLLAANLGEDADTVAAIYGQIAGAYFGVNRIPLEWRDKLAKVEEIEALADLLQLHSL